MEDHDYVYAYANIPLAFIENFRKMKSKYIEHSGGLGAN